MPKRQLPIRPQSADKKSGLLLFQNKQAHPSEDYELNLMDYHAIGFSLTSLMKVNRVELTGLVCKHALETLNKKDSVYPPDLPEFFSQVKLPFIQFITSVWDIE